MRTMFLSVEVVLDAVVKLEIFDIAKVWLSSGFVAADFHFVFNVNTQPQR